MLKQLTIIFFIIFSYNGLATAYSIVFVHLGESMCPYLIDSYEQARLFNKTCPIYIIASKRAFSSTVYPTINDPNLHLINAESLPRSKKHVSFLQKAFKRRVYASPFWIYASERFFYLDEFMQKYDVKDVFHLENDVMLYVDLAELLPIFQEHYEGIAATFDNDSRCIPGFLYIAHKTAMKQLVRYFDESGSKENNDMEVVAQYRSKNKTSFIDHLPIIVENYQNKYALKSTAGHTTVNPNAYSKHCELFNSIFDAAAIGQFLGGEFHKATPGFINESCLFNPSFLTYEWISDKHQRKVPYAIFEGKYYRINNLHIHSKQLKKFSSVNREKIDLE